MTLDPSTLGPNPTTQQVYEFQRAYFTRPGAVLAKDTARGTCNYRDAGGAKCAVGCLISDELYDSQPSDVPAALLYGLDHSTLGGVIENKRVTVIIQIPALTDLLNGDSDEGRRKLDFLDKTQDIHDNPGITTAAEFVAELDRLAVSEGLTIPDPK